MKVRNPGSNYLYAEPDPYGNYNYGSKYMDAIKYLYNTISLHPFEFVKAAREETCNENNRKLEDGLQCMPSAKRIERLDAKSI